jgi:hypothetical protein
MTAATELQVTRTGAACVGLFTVQCGCGTLSTLGGGQSFDIHGAGRRRLLISTNAMRGLSHQRRLNVNATFESAGLVISTLLSIIASLARLIANFNRDIFGRWH